MSTPPEGQSVGRSVLEPTYVVRRRRTEALAALVQEFREREDGPGESFTTGQDRPTAYESIVVSVAPPEPEEVTEVMPPVSVAAAVPPLAAWPRQEQYGDERPLLDERYKDDGPSLRRAAVIVGVTAAALIGFGAALVLPGSARGEDSRHTATPPVSASAGSPAAQATPSTDPDGAGTLREGDTGPAVTELQQRLRRIPDVYTGGPVTGRYDATLTAAVARFQLWYGIRGDESGVYGNDTRRDLESRTTL
ncbi:Peptidoglycan-binding domain 1 protein [Actinobacteria bacterium OK074]|nr:Peptidoglycan-binding domain 1 protein [Actinobacteria bacterium OK074]